MHIGVYGSGYVGTVISACLADFGNPVTCYGPDSERITSTAQGAVPFYEKNLKDVIRRNVRAGRLIYSTDFESFAKKSELIFLAEDTCSSIDDVALQISGLASSKAVLALVTPVPVGTARGLEQKLRAAGHKQAVVSHPVFLTDGCAIEDFNWPDRVVIGTDNSDAVMMLKHIYRPLAMRGVPVIVTNYETAELVR
ncbi:MAG: UDP-glucose/GDP-mannose dehydrogenase family protein, partial [Acidobacteria bacterium]|nr:UDP-glucose/GDP-mannose dehydrogenase family protein [Acidobacteriota bacterium]